MQVPSQDKGRVGGTRASSPSKSCTPRRKVDAHLPGVPPHAVSWVGGTGAASPSKPFTPRHGRTISAQFWSFAIGGAFMTQLSEAVCG